MVCEQEKRAEWNRGVLPAQAAVGQLHQRMREWTLYARRTPDIPAQTATPLPRHERVAVLPGGRVYQVLLALAPHLSLSAVPLVSD